MGRSPPPAHRRHNSARSRSRSYSAPRRGRSRGRSPIRSRSRSGGRRNTGRNARSPPRSSARSTPRKSVRSPPRRRSRSYSSSSASSSASSRSRSRSRSSRRQGGARRTDDRNRRRSRSASSRSSSGSSRSRSRSRSKARSPSAPLAPAARPGRVSRWGPKREATAASDTATQAPKRECSVTPPRELKRDAQTESPANEPTPRKRVRSLSNDPPSPQAHASERHLKAAKRRSETRRTPERTSRVKDDAMPAAASTRASDNRMALVATTLPIDTKLPSDTKLPTDTKLSASIKHERTTCSQSTTPPRATRDNTQRAATPSRDTTPPRAAAAAASSSSSTTRQHKRSPNTPADGSKTPPRKAARSSRRSRRSTTSSSSSSSVSSKSDQTPPRKKSTTTTRRKRTKRRTRSASRSSSDSSSSSSSSSSDSERTPPRRRNRTDKRSKRKSAEKPSRRSTTATKDDSPTTPPAPAAAVRVDLLLPDTKRGRTGGVYMPPFKLAQLHAAQAATSTDKTSSAYQRQTWDALRKSINGLINKVNVSNLANIIPELFSENLVRARGLLARSIMKAQLASPGFTHIYAALVAVINTKMPENGELVLKRVVYRFRRAFQRGDKVVAIALVRFIAHLVNQQVVHELLALEVLTLLLANPTDDSVEVAVNFTKECGQILAELCPEGLRAIFERFRGILHEGAIDKRVQYTIEGLFAIRKGGFVDYPAVHAQLDLVESGDQITHETTLEETIDREEQLDVFRVDPEYEKNEAMWTAIKKELLGESDSDSEDGSSSGSDADAEDDDDDGDAGSHPNPNQMQQHAIQDLTEQDLVNLRRTIYLTIMSSMSHEECAHKLMKLNIRAGQEKEICSMLLECCSQERTYLRYYGLLGQRFCLIKREYQDAFDTCFAEQYALIHRLETNKLRNVAKFFAHLLMTDALPWTVFEYIRLNEDETTSSSRIFIKILCQELSEHMGLPKLKSRFLDAIMERTFAGLFPKDSPRNTRFAINFFTSIGLGGLTTELRDHLKNAPTIIMAQNNKAPSSSDTSSSESSSSSSGSSSSDTSSSDSSSDSD